MSAGFQYHAPSRHHHAPGGEEEEGDVDEGNLSISPIRSQSRSFARSATPSTTGVDPSRVGGVMSVDRSSGRSLPSGGGYVDPSRGSHPLPVNPAATAGQWSASMRRGSPGYVVQNPPQPGHRSSSSSSQPTAGPHHFSSVDQPASAEFPVHRSSASPSADGSSFWGHGARREYDTEDLPHPFRSHDSHGASPPTAPPPPPPVPRQMSRPPPVEWATDSHRPQHRDSVASSGRGSGSVVGSRNNTHRPSPSPDQAAGAFAVLPQPLPSARHSGGFHHQHSQLSHGAQQVAHLQQQNQAHHDRVKRDNWKFLNRFVGQTLEGPSSWKYGGPEAYFDFTQ